MTRRALSCSDVLLAFNKAREAAGDQAALAVVKRLGASYAATIAPENYEVAIRALAALIRPEAAAATPGSPNKKAA